MLILQVVIAMTKNQIDPLQVKIPLDSNAYAAAETAYVNQVSSRRKQIYLNVLAIHAVKQYLQWLAIPTDWSQCDSYTPIMRQFLNVADLEIKGYGRLECRPLLPGEEILDIPSEVHNDRIGYVAVQFDEELEVATLVGFTKTVNQCQISLESLEPIDALLRIIGTASASLSPIEDISEELLYWQEPTRLDEWFSHQFTELVNVNWRPLEELKNLFAPEVLIELGYGTRGLAVAIPENQVKRGKLVGLEKGDEQIALVVGLQESTTPETEISVEVYPTGKRTYLPKNLELMVLDETGEAVMQAQSRSNRRIQMEFSGETGEEFSIKLALGDFTVTEAFQI